MPRAVILLAIVACGGEPAATPRAIRFLHTFDAKETELFNSTMAERRLAVESSLVPFARGQQVIGEILRRSSTSGDCPDLIRIDATWLPELVKDKLLQTAPSDLQQLDWTPEAAALAQWNNAWWSVPETVDGLVVARDADLPAPKSPSIDDLIAAARAARSPQAPHPLGLRADGYWFVPWLRAEGAELAPGPAVGAEHALGKFAALFGDLAPPPPAAGGEAPEEQREWNAREIAYWVTGPWQIGAVKDRERIAVTPLAHAPRGGQLLVVPVCARDPRAGWDLARTLTDVTVELVFADAFATVPTRTAAFKDAPPLAVAQYRALQSAEMLPRSPVTPQLFDDLNPAVSAAVEGDATADEAIAGVRRGWQRLVR